MKKKYDLKIKPCNKNIGAEIKQFGKCNDSSKSKKIYTIEEKLNKEFYEFIYS